MRHVRDCKTVTKGVKNDALEALDELLSYLSPADPEGGVAYYMTRTDLGETAYVRAYQVLRDNGRRP